MKRSKKASFVSIAFLLMLFGLFSQPALADFEGDPWPGHVVSKVSCESTPGNFGYGAVHSFPPSFLRSWGEENELTIWAPSLYRLVGNKWVLWSDQMTPAYALATPNGISGGWFNLHTHEALTASSLEVPYGTYTIFNSIFWNSAYLFHHEWATNSCTVI